MVSDEALKKLQEQIAAWPMTQRFVVQQLIRDYLRNREDLRAYEATELASGSRTKGEEKRSFGGYTQYPNNAEVYSLEEWQESGYGAGDVCKVDEPVQMCIGFCKKYKKYDTVLVPLDQYVKYCECACLPLDKPKGV